MIPLPPPKIFNSDIPTEEELEKFPALRDAWEEYLVIRRLTLGSKDESKSLPGNWSVWSDY